jgi:hypothetical protein
MPSDGNRAVRPSPAFPTQLIPAPQTTLTAGRNCVASHGSRCAFLAAGALHRLPATTSASAPGPAARVEPQQQDGGHPGQRTGHPEKDHGISGPDDNIVLPQRVEAAP